MSYRLEAIIKELKVVSEMAVRRDGKGFQYDKLTNIDTKSVKQCNKDSRSRASKTLCEIHNNFYKTDQSLTDHHRDVYVNVYGKNVRCSIVTSYGYKYADLELIERYAKHHGCLFKVLDFDLYYNCRDHITVLVYPAEFETDFTLPKSEFNPCYGV